MSIENNNTAAIEIVETPVVAVETAQAIETPVATAAVETVAEILEANKAAEVTIRDSVKSRFNHAAACMKLAATPSVLAVLAGVLMFLVGSWTTASVVASSAGDAVAKAEAARDAAVAEADRALAVAKAEQGVPPTFWQSLYGVTVKPVGDGASYAYNGAKSIDGRAYNTVTSTFGSAAERSTEAPEVKVVAQAPAAPAETK